MDDGADVGTAPAAGERTGDVMAHGLDTLHRTRAQLTAIKGGRPAGVAQVPSPAALATLPTAPSWPPRDGVKRALGAPAMDGQNRIAIVKLASHLGWAAGTDLVLCVERGRVRVWAGVVSTPAELPSQYRAGRMTLPAAARARLDVGVGDMVFASTASSGELLLLSGADVAQAIDADAEPVPAALPAPLPAAKRGGVKPAWRAPAASGG